MALLYLLEMVQPCSALIYTFPYSYIYLYIYLFMRNMLFCYLKRSNRREIKILSCLPTFTTVRCIHTFEFESSESCEVNQDSSPLKNTCTMPYILDLSRRSVRWKPYNICISYNGMKFQYVVFRIFNCGARKYLHVLLYVSSISVTLGHWFKNISPPFDTQTILQSRAAHLLSFDTKVTFIGRVSLE